MSIESVPSSIWRVQVPRKSAFTRTFTTRQEVRDYRARLQGQGFNRDQINFTRFPVGTGISATA